MHLLGDARATLFFIRSDEVVRNHREESQESRLSNRIASSTNSHVLDKSRQTNHWQKIAAMKAIVLIGVMALIALGIFAVLSLMQRQATDKLVQGEGEIHEKKQEIADARAFAREGSNDPNPVEHSTGVSGPSWVGRFQHVIENCERAIKNLPKSLGPRHQSRLAPPGVYFTLTYLSMRIPSGITGLEPGTQVVCVKDEGPVLLVKAGSLEFEAKRQYLTNDLDVADLAVRNDAEAQQAVASYIAQQQQAIDQRHDRRKMQPSANTRIVGIYVTQPTEWQSIRKQINVAFNPTPRNAYFLAKLA